MKKGALLANVRSAKNQVAEAEDELAQLLRQLQGTARAEKTTISKALEAAFQKLRSAREQLVSLETLAAQEDD